MLDRVASTALGPTYKKPTAADENRTKEVVNPLPASVELG